MWPSTDSIACGRPKPAPQRQPSANLRSSREQDRTTVGKRAEWDTGFLKTPARFALSLSSRLSQNELSGRTGVDEHKLAGFFLIYRDLQALPTYVSEA